jgi:hypothetical protein
VAVFSPTADSSFTLMTVDLETGRRLAGPSEGLLPAWDSTSPDRPHLQGERPALEIYVQPWPALDRKHPVSKDGGSELRWSRNGKEIYFRRGRYLMSSRITTSPSFGPIRR